MGARSDWDISWYILLEPQNSGYLVLTYRTGDYFGILMDARVTGFPFSVTDAPMYYGSTMSFLAVALWFAKPAGIVLTLLVFVVYKFALMFEEYVSPLLYGVFFLG